ncbi:MAG: imuA [Caulobacteraceae bacterium]|nr:imuA [Caulobacteraceae bacterium]
MQVRASHSVLKARIAALEGHTRSSRSRLSLGLAEIDLCLGGGLMLGSWHDLTGQAMDEETGSAAAAFGLDIINLLPGGSAVIWVQMAGDLYPPALPESLAPLKDFICIDARDQACALSVIEEALSTQGLAVVGEIEALSLIAGRRLQLAAERGGGLGLILRRRLGARRLSPGSAVAASRWRIGRLPSLPPAGLPGLGTPRWQVELEHCRGGRPGGWILETCERKHGAHPFRLVAPLADHGLADPSPAQERRRSVA